MRTRFFVLIAALGASLSCLSACSSVQYSAAPITAQVVDAETGKPLADVNVVAHWQLEGGLEGGTSLGAVTAMETVTGNDGRFHFPAWGPVEVQRPSGVYRNARVRSMAPELLFFKGGYSYERELNYMGGDPDPKNLRSLWDGQVIKLEPFHGNSKQYAEALGGLSDNLYRYLAFGSWTCSAEGPCLSACQWQNTPNMIRAIGKQFKIFEAEEIHKANIYSSLMRNDKLYQELGCASPVMVLGEDFK